MSERKVLNKYYPPDYDPAKIPRLKRAKDRQYVIRVMAPFHMRCKTCGNYIYKGTKFNARQETVQDKDYLGLRIYRFYIKCTRCVAEITFLTDPENQDYSMEHGATRNFEAEKLLDEQRKREEQQQLEDAANPMKMLEKRTRDSKREMEMMETLEDLREQNEQKASLDIDKILAKRLESDEERIAREEKEDEEELRTMLPRNKRLPEKKDPNDLEESIKRCKAKYGITNGANLAKMSSSSENSVVDVQPKRLTAQKLGIVIKHKKKTGKTDEEPPAKKSAQFLNVTLIPSKSLLSGNALSALSAYGSSSEDEK